MIYLQLFQACLAVIPLPADLVYKALQMAVPGAAHVRHRGLRQAALYQCLQEGHQYGKLQASTNLATIRAVCHTAQSINPAVWALVYQYLSEDRHV